MVLRFRRHTLFPQPASIGTGKKRSSAKVHSQSIASQPNQTRLKEQAYSTPCEQFPPTQWTSDQPSQNIVNTETKHNSHQKHEERPKQKVWRRNRTGNELRPTRYPSKRCRGAIHYRRMNSGNRTPRKIISSANAPNSKKTIQGFPSCLSQNTRTTEADQTCQTHTLPSACDQEQSVRKE